MASSLLSTAIEWDGVTGIVLSVLGIALSFPATIKQLAEIADDYRDRKDDSRKFALRISVQISQLQNLCSLLFGPASPPNHHDEPPLFKRLNTDLQKDVCNILVDICTSVQTNYNTLKKKYGLRSPTAPRLLPAQPAQPVQPARIDASSPSPSDEPGFQVSWAFWGKRRVKAVVEELELWNETLLFIVIAQSLVIETSRRTTTPTAKMRGLLKRIANLRDRDNRKLLGGSIEGRAEKQDSQGDDGGPVVIEITGLEPPVRNMGGRRMPRLRDRKK